MPSSNINEIKRVSIFGPESTGKTTLSKNLARHFNTSYVPEFAREYFDLKHCKFTFEDMPAVVRGQLNAEKLHARKANQVLFCDTDNALTTIYSEMYYRKCEQWIYEKAAKNHYDLTLLLNIDVPWISDHQRDFPHRREEIFARCKQRLEEFNREFVIISGNWEKRLKQAIEIVQSLIRVKNE